MQIQTISNIMEVVGWMKWNIKHDYDNVIAITGGEGKGKSYFAMRFARLLWKAFHVGRYSEGNYWYEVREYYDMMEDESPGYTVCSDESIRAVYKRSAMTREQKELMRDLYMNRGDLKNQLWMVPTLDAFDNDMKGHRIRWWIYIPWRKNYDDKPWFDYAWAEVWYFEEMKWAQISSKYPPFRRHFLGGFPWKPPKKHEVREYTKMKRENLNERRAKRHGIYDE